MKILFLLKYRTNYSEIVDSTDPATTYYSSGLLNSARFVNDMLRAQNIESNIVQIQDNNDIDREVSKYRPTHVIIEAMWVVPEKFAILTELHPTVKWIIRTHSDIPFLSNEGIAVDWLRRYIEYPGVYIGANSQESLRDIRSLLHHSEHKIAEYYHMPDLVIYLPNYYPLLYRPASKLEHNSNELNIACFGAIRPLKNNLMQAIAAVEFAKKKDKKLNFHINGSRQEQGGVENIKNIRALFADTDNTLVEHPWMSHAELLTVLATMDASMSVSFTETFNIVSADSVSVGCPIVVSNEIFWASSLAMADPNNREEIIKTLDRVTSKYTGRIINYFNYNRLEEYNKQSIVAWRESLLNIEF